VRNNEDLEQTLAPVLSDLKAAARADAIDFVSDPAFDVEIEPKAQERGA
jgi:hypothetical protein